MKNDNTNFSQHNSYPMLFGLMRREMSPNGVWKIKLVWSRICAFFALLAVVLWVAFTIFVMLFFKYIREYDEMTLAKAIKFPFARKEFRVEMGNYNIKMAEECIKNHKWREAYVNLSFGVGRSPANVKGVMMLSEFYISGFFRRPDLAIKTMENSLLYAMNDTQFVRLYMRTLMDQIEDKRLVTVGEKLLSNPELKNQEVVAYLAMSISSVYAMHGNFEKSKEYLIKYKLDKTLPGILRLSKNEWEMGNREEAIQIIADNFNYAENKEPFYALLVNYYTIMGDIEKARQYSMLRSIENPFSIEQRLEYVNLQRKSGELKDVDKAIEEIFSQYSKDNSAMLILGNYAADSGNIKLMRRIYDVAISNNFQIGAYCLLLLETMITTEDYQGAVKFAEDILKDKPVWMKRYEDVLACLRAISYYATGNINMADILITDLLNRNTATPRVLVATARRLDNLGGQIIARRLLENAVDRFPRHQLALTRLVQLDIKQGNSTNLDKHIVKLLGMRRPPRELVLDARKSLASDRFIFTNNREKVMKEIDTLVDVKNAGALSDYIEEQDRVMSSDTINL